MSMVQSGVALDRAASPRSDWAEVVGSPRSWARDVAIGGFLAIWIGALGPFGSFHAGPPLTRVAYFASLLLPCLALYGPAMRLAGKLGQRFGVSLWLSIPAAIVLASLPFSVIIDVVAPAYFPQLRGKVSPIEAYLEVLTLMLPACCAFALAERLLASRRSPSPPTTASRVPESLPPPDERDAPPLCLRLPAGLGCDVVAMRAEDHYVRVYTQLGSHLILLRFRDAISELGDEVGFRVHRSWWVAERAIERVCGRGRKLRLRLVTGLEVPVARTSAVRVRAVGWT